MTQPEALVISWAAGDTIRVHPDDECLETCTPAGAVIRNAVELAMLRRRASPFLAVARAPDHSTPDAS